MYNVSVITATQARPSRMGWLHELWQSLDQNSCTWEWLIAVDGDDSTSSDKGNAKFIPKNILHDSRVTVVNLEQRFGTAVARNVALGLAQGETITSADDDDLLTPESLNVRFVRLMENPGYGWVAGMLGNLWLDCSHCGDVGCWNIANVETRAVADDLANCSHAAWRQEMWDSPAQPGFYRAGDVAELVTDWAKTESHGGTPSSMRYIPGASVPPLGPTTLLMHSELLNAIGGWHGLPQGEDLGMLLAATSFADGFVLPDEVYLYRKHAGQTVAKEGFDRWEGFVRRVSASRGQALAKYLNSGGFFDRKST